MHYRVFSSIPGFYPLEMPVANSQLPSVTKIPLVAQMVKNLPAMQETGVRSLRWEDPLKKGKATHSNILAWRIPGLQRDMTERLLLSSCDLSLATVLALEQV